MTRILIVEDDIAFGTMMQTWLKKKGFDVDKATSVGAAVRLIGDKPAYDLVLSDLRLPDRDGLELLAWMHKNNMLIPFIVMTNYAEVQNAVLAMKSGAADYIAKPIQPDILLSKIKDALKNADNATAAATTPTNNTTTTPQHHNTTTRHIEGNSEASRQLYSYVSLVAPTPMSVLILGASGTGKEYVARRIHEQSQRAGKPFVALDCGAIPRDVAASEFFGHKKGAFTGADADKRGAFEAANGGTLFLDEVGNLSYDVQVQLLRALQERRIRPLGGTEERPIDIRLVAATNENLEQAVAEGRFREDLYHRLSEFTIYMPQLSERGTDLYLFADLFVRLANEELSRHVEGFDARAAEKLASTHGPAICASSTTSLSVLFSWHVAHSSHKTSSPPPWVLYVKNPSPPSTMPMPSASAYSMHYSNVAETSRRQHECWASTVRRYITNWGNPHIYCGKIPHLFHTFYTFP